jgi:hypothetical protein
MTSWMYVGCVGARSFLLVVFPVFDPASYVSSGVC